MINVKEIFTEQFVTLLNELHTENVYLVSKGFIIST